MIAEDRHTGRHHRKQACNQAFYNADNTFTDTVQPANNQSFYDKWVKHFLEGGGGQAYDTEF